MKTRFTGGLAVATLLGAGLLCPEGASAADAAGYPHTLGFEPSRLIATDDAVYAIGMADTTALVAEVGGDSVEFGADVFGIQAALEPDGDLLVLTSDDEGQHLYTVSTADLEIASGPITPAHQVDVLGSDSVDVFGVVDVDGAPTLDADNSLIELSPGHAAASAAASAGAAGSRSWYVAGTQWDENGEDATATLWSHHEGSEEPAVPVTLGAEGDPDHFALDVAADADGDAVYALTFRDNEDAPQSYGLTVVQDGPDTYLPLRYRAQDIALSPDGERIYLASNDSVLALDTDRLADYEDESDADAVSVDSSVTALTVSPAGTVLAASDSHAVHAFSAPAAPTGLTATPDSMSTTAVTASWSEGKYAWELAGAEDLAEYSYAVRHGDEVVSSGSTFDQVVLVDGLRPGTTYTVEVTESNGLFTSPPATVEVTTHGRHVGAPSAVSVQGSLTVGSRLSLASTGSWEDGTTLAYEWYGSAGEMGGAIGSGPTLTLTADHVGMTVTGVVTGTKAGAAGVTRHASGAGVVTTPPVVTPPATTPVVPPVTPPPATPSVMTASKPKIEGKAKVGRTLVAKPGAWTPGVKLAYQWSANGKEIKGADGSRLKLTKALKGKKISVEVTGTKAGYPTVTKSSAQTGKVRR